MSLVTTKEMLKKAYDGGYAVGAFNFSNMEILQGITEACYEESSPVILQVLKSVLDYAGIKFILRLIDAVQDTYPELPFALHLDHGTDFEVCKFCIDNGFTSVMIDASGKPFHENIEITRKIADYAHERGVTVEAELGTVSGAEGDLFVSAEDAYYTRPEEVAEFVSKTNCDSLAIAIGTSHGAYKFKPGTEPRLQFEVLHQCEKLIPGFPIVLHGASTVPQEYVKMINEYGGNIPGAIGIPEAQLRKAAESAVCKINIASDNRLCMTGTIRKYMAENPAEFDPRAYLKPARNNIKEVVRHRLINVLGCAGKA